MHTIPTSFTPSIFERWLSSLELLARYFPSFPEMYHESIKWLWNQQISPGLWDFGRRYVGSTSFPLSIDWRTKNRKFHDWSARMLLLFVSIA
ncbi:hypothetical protein [Candidatus Lokiarchaeum ossiferum]|uniref:hypothetical protein n=1 Tax=Candidatus Lokiarchaeum ossiferum TaxID=2951803 RepID=UPI00352CB510